MDKTQYRQHYKKTLNGWLTKVYGRMTQSSKERGMNLGITKKELRQFAIENNIQGMLDFWVRNDCKKDLVPSINRLDDYNNYSLNNIELITWEQNNKLGVKSIKTIKEVHNKLGDIAKKKFSKKVEHRDLDGKLLNTYKSVRETGRRLGIDPSCISKVCRGEIKTYFNNQFNYV